HACARRRWAVDPEWTGARSLVAILHEQERDATEVIPVEMREEHEIERRRIMPPALERLEDGGTAINQERHPGRLDEIAAVEAPAGAVSVSRAQHGDPHLRHADRSRPHRRRRPRRFRAPRTG